MHTQSSPEDCYCCELLLFPDELPGGFDDPSELYPLSSSASFQSNYFTDTPAAPADLSAAGLGDMPMFQQKNTKQNMLLS